MDNWSEWSPPYAHVEGIDLEDRSGLSRCHCPGVNARTESAQFGLFSRQPLAARPRNRTEQGVAEAIGADRLIYQTVDGLIQSVQKGNPRIRQFDTSVFTGEYVTGGVSTDYLERLASSRNDDAKGRQATGVSPVLELHNSN